MKNSPCLSEQELILYHYGEPRADQAQGHAHLAACPRCAQRMAALQHDLARLPQLVGETDPAAATRLAARVMERLPQRRRSWRPAIAAAAVAACALSVTLALWPTDPQPQPQHTALTTPRNTTALLVDEEMPEVDFLEELELLRELELLSQVEGV